MQVIDSSDGLHCETNNHVTLTQTRLLRRTTSFHPDHHHTGLSWQIEEAHDAPVQRHGLRFDSDISAANAALLQQTTGNKLCRVDANGKAQPLRTHDGCCVYADDSSIG